MKNNEITNEDTKELESTPVSKEARSLHDAKFAGEDEYNNEFGEEDEDEDSGSGKMMHLIFLILVLIIIGIMVFALAKWQKGRDLVITEDDLTENYDIESMEYYSHFDPTEYEGYVDDGVMRILILGDDAMYYCDDESTSIGAYIAEATGAEVVTLALPGQTISNSVKGYDLENPEDSYNLYYVSQALSAGSDGDYSLMTAAWPYMDDSTLYVEYWEKAHSYVPEEFDIIIINLGVNDYLLARPLLGDEIHEEQIYGLGDGVGGALNGALQLLKNRFPATQIIVSSPTFILTEDADGNLTGADTVNNGEGYYGDYIACMAALCERNSITFVDNYFDDEFNPGSYDGYLEDNHIYPNAAGRKIVADNIVADLYFIRNNRNQ